MRCEIRVPENRSRPAAYGSRYAGLCPGVQIMTELAALKIARNDIKAFIAHYAHGQSHFDREYIAPHEQALAIIENRIFEIERSENMQRIVNKRIISW